MKPERVHINDEIYYFYFPTDGYEPVSRQDDYEPVALKEDQSHKAITSRYHWDLITVWLDPVLLNDKPKISFVSAWHTPVAQCMDYKMRLVAPESMTTIKNMKQGIEALTLYSLFQPLIYGNIRDKFSGQPISYSDIVTKDPVNAKYTFSFAKMKGMAIIGPSDKMPSQIKEEIDKFRAR